MIDRFLGRLERMESLIKNGVIRAQDFEHYFSYWLNLLDENNGSSKTHLATEKRTVFWNYVREYQFNGVVALFARYGKATPIRRRNGLTCSTRHEPR